MTEQELTAAMNLQLPMDDFWYYVKMEPEAQEIGAPLSCTLNGYEGSTAPASSTNI